VDFLTWWFEQHPIWSTFLCPFWTVLWGIYTNNAIKVLWAVAWYFTILCSKLVIRDVKTK